MVGRSSDLQDGGRVIFPSAKVKLAYRRTKTKSGAHRPIQRSGHMYSLLHGRRQRLGDPECSQRGHRLAHVGRNFGERFQQDRARLLAAQDHTGVTATSILPRRTTGTYDVALASRFGAQGLEETVEVAPRVVFDGARQTGQAGQAFDRATSLLKRREQRGQSVSGLQTPRKTRCLTSRMGNSGATLA